MNLKLLSSLVLTLAGASDAARTFVPNAAVNKAISVRGGAGPLPAEATAKVATALYGLQGTFGYLAPAKNNEAYGLEGDNIDSFIQEVASAKLLSTAITAYAVVSKGMPVLQAIGAGLVPQAVLGVKALLNDTPSEVGVSSGGIMFDTLFTAVTTYGALTGADYAGNAVKAYIVYTALATLQCRLAPKSALKAWGFPEKSIATKSFMTKILGQQGIGWSVLAWSLTNDVDALTAIGYASIPGFLSLMDFATSGEMEANGGDINMLLPWGVIMAAIIGTLAIP